MNIELKGPKTVTLSPQTVAIILDALSEKPYKTVVGAMGELIDQLQTEKKADAPKSVGEGG